MAESFSEPISVHASSFEDEDEIAGSLSLLPRRPKVNGTTVETAVESNILDDFAFLADHSSSYHTTEKRKRPLGLDRSLEARISSINAPGVTVGIDDNPPYAPVALDEVTVPG